MLQVAEMADSTEVRETLIETPYLGTHPRLAGTTGEAYQDLQNGGIWCYRPKGLKTFYKVNVKNLDVMQENGWIKCSYLGDRPFGKEGKAQFDEDADCWLYKPKGTQDLYRIKNEANLKFRRDEDTGLDS
jgi:hypothetical protein